MVGKGDPKGQQGVFDTELGFMLDPNHPLYRLTQKIRWADIERDLAVYYKSAAARRCRSG